MLPLATALAGTPEEAAKRFQPGLPPAYSAALAWVAADPAHARQLVDALRADLPMDLWMACNALAETPVEEAGPVVVRHLAHPEQLPRSGCTRAYGAWVVTFGGDLAPLVARLDDPDCDIRAFAAEPLAATGRAPDLVERWRRTLAAPHAGCDVETALAGLAGDHAGAAISGPIALRVYADPAWDAGLRDSAGYALWSLRFAPAHDTWRRMLVGEDPGMNLRMWAIRGLWVTGTPADLPALDAVIALDPSDGQGVWAIEGRQAKAAIQARAKGP